MHFSSLSLRLAALAAVLLSFGPLRADTLSYADLAGRLTDLQQLATPPAPGELGLLASSYDRHRRYDAALDQYLDWNAHDDASFGGYEFEPVDSGRTVLLNVRGPGCIWRIGSSAPGPGHVRIYLDGGNPPAVDLSFAGYFDRRNAPFNRPHLVYETKAAGFDNLTPIPFQTSCLIVADRNWGRYYRIHYTIFPQDTRVPTFTRALAPADAAALDCAEGILSRAGEDPHGPLVGEKTESIDSVTPAGRHGGVVDFRGEGAITALRLKFAPGTMPADAAGRRTFLRQLALRIGFDGAKNPQVWAPFGDFFGEETGAGPRAQLPCGVTPDGTWYAYWYMPFARRAVITLENDSDREVSLHWEIAHAPLDRDPATLLRFHAKWHRDAAAPMRPDRQPDWSLLATKGAGRYVGARLQVWNPAGDGLGEGDEKWFVDGEKFPSGIGTGLEDSFGSAWTFGKSFVLPLQAQTCAEDNRGHLSVDRWQLADNVPFHAQFEGSLEKYFPNEHPAIFAATVFWYLGSSGSDPYAPVPVRGRVGYWTP